MKARPSAEFPTRLVRESSVYDLVARLCTVEQIQDLLRRYKPVQPKEVLISAPKKEALVRDNLREAVAAGAIPEVEVYSLLDRAEENGNQHLFYYRPRNRATARRYHQGERIADSLWGAGWRETMGFPHLQLVPQDTVWADFTIGKYEKKPNDWTAKLYGHEIRYHYTGRTEVRGDFLYREYSIEEERTVSLVRFNRGGRGRDLLEIRVPRANSQALVKSREERVWAELEGTGGGTPGRVGAISRGDFVEWDMGPARLRLLREQGQWRTLYRLGDTRLLDSASGVAQFSPYTEDENLYTVQEREEAVGAFLAHHGECPQLAVTWLPTGAKTLSDRGLFQRSVRTILGDRTSNEVIFLPNVAPEVVDHVTDQLRHFNR